MHGGFDGCALDGRNKRVSPERLMLLGVSEGNTYLSVRGIDWMISMA